MKKKKSNAERNKDDDSCLSYMKTKSWTWLNLFIQPEAIQNKQPNKRAHTHK